MSPETETILERAFVESLLEERFGRAAPDTGSGRPGNGALDGAAQVSDAESGTAVSGAPDAAAAPDRRWPLVAAAAILLGIGSVATAVWRSRPDADEHSAAPAPQDKPTRPEISTGPWRPPDLAALRQVLGEVDRVQVRLHVIGQYPVKVPDFPDGPLVTIYAGRAALAEFRQLLDETLARPLAAPAGGPQPVGELRLLLPEHRHVAIDLAPDRRVVGLRLQVDGLGGFAAEPRLAQAVAAGRIAAAGVEAKTIASLGLAMADRLGDLPASAPHLRLLGFDTGDLGRLSRFTRATSVDLRYAPRVNDAAALGALHAALPGLRTLRVRGEGLDAAALAALARFRDLSDLQILAPDGSYWGVPAGRDAAKVDDAAVPALLRLTALRSLVIPGSDLSDTGLAALAGLPRLQRLILSGSPRILGTGFAAFADHHALGEVHLNGCRGLEDDGLRALAKVPELRQLFLRQARFLRAGFAGLGGNLGGGGLAALGACRRLQRLELGGWFTMSRTHPEAFRELARGGGSVLDQELRAALAAVCRAPALEWLALDECPDLVLADLEGLRGSPIQTLNLARTLGAPPARIPQSATDAVFALPRDLQTLITVN